MDNRTVNNKYAGCPAIMMDGRILTDYRPSLYVDSMLMQANGIGSSNDYRKFLMNNALSLIKTNDVYVERRLETMCNQDAKPSQAVNRVCSFNHAGGMSCLVKDPHGLGDYIQTGDVSYDQSAQSAKADPASPEQPVEGYCQKMTHYGSVQ